MIFIIHIMFAYSSIYVVYYIEVEPLLNFIREATIEYISNFFYDTNWEGGNSHILGPISMADKLSPCRIVVCIRRYGYSYHSIQI
jgi:hypothetical protein